MNQEQFRIGEKVMYNHEIFTIIDLGATVAFVKNDNTGKNMQIAYNQLRKSAFSSHKRFTIGQKVMVDDELFTITDLKGNYANAINEITKNKRKIKYDEVKSIPTQMDIVETELPDTLSGIQHYFLWVSHGYKLGSEQSYKIECPPSVSKMNFFIESGYIMRPLVHDRTWENKYSEIITDIHRVINTFRQPTTVMCKLDVESQKQTTSLPSLVFYGRQQQIEPEYIYKPMGLYHYEMQANGSFSTGTKVTGIPEDISSPPIFYSDIFKIIKDYIKSQKLQGSIGIGFFCCRSQHPIYETSTIRHLSGDYVEPVKYVPLEPTDNKYWFLMTLNDIDAKYRYIFETGDQTKWTALLQSKRKGCGINVLSILGFINQDQGREIVACLPATGTTMYKICDYISQRYPGLKLGIYNLLLNVGNVIHSFETLLTLSAESNYCTIVKLYTSLEHDGEPSEVGHTIILVINRGTMVFYDPQQSRIYYLPQLLEFGYVSMDIILCNSNAGDPSRHNIAYPLQLKVRKSKWIAGGSQNFDELYAFIEANQIDTKYTPAQLRINDTRRSNYKKSRKTNKSNKTKTNKSHKTKTNKKR